MAPLTQKDAWEFCGLVRKTFLRSPHKYNEFLRIMQDFKAQRCSTVAVVERVRDLFQGKPELIKGFNRFLPDGITVSNVKCPKNHTRFPDAMRFVNKVKARFNGGPVYKRFVEILNRHRVKPFEEKELYELVASLFGHEHGDLTREFGRYLPSEQRAKAIADLSRLFSRL